MDRATKEQIPQVEQVSDIHKFDTSSLRRSAHPVLNVCAVAVYDLTHDVLSPRDVLFIVRGQGLSLMGSTFKKPFVIQRTVFLYKDT